MSLTDTLASSFCSLDAVEDVEILVRRRARFALVRDALAEQVERGGDALGVQRADGGERVVERLAGDEPRRELLGQRVVPNEAEDPRLVREIEQR